VKSVTSNCKGSDPRSQIHKKSSKEGKRGFERERDKLPEDIAPLALAWRRGTSMEVSWRVDSQDLQETSDNRRTLR
jgi:hypothetical protein